MSAIFSIDGQHVEITPALDTYVRDKLKKIERIFPHTTKIHVVLTIEKKKKQQIAEAEVHLAGDKNPVFASAVTNDMYNSIDMLEDKLVTQVKKYHDKITNHHHHSKESRDSKDTL